MLFFRWPIVRGYMNVCNCMEGMVYIAVSKSDLFLFRVDVCIILFIILMDGILELPSEKVRRLWSLFLQKTLASLKKTGITMAWWNDLKQNLKHANEKTKHGIVLKRVVYKLYNAKVNRSWAVWRMNEIVSRRKMARPSMRLRRSK